MMIGGAVGFYLGIDTPPLRFHPTNDQPSNGDTVEKIDSAEFLSALGTFLAGFSAFASVGLIVLRHDPHIAWTIMIMAGWVRRRHANHCRSDSTNSPLRRRPGRALQKYSRSRLMEPNL